MSEISELCASGLTEKDLQKLTIKVNSEGQLYLIISDE